MIKIKDDSLETTKNKKSDMNLTLKSTDFLECKKIKFYINNCKKNIWKKNYLFLFDIATIGADETMASDANKQFLKTFLNKSNESLVKLMKNEGPLHINFK